MFHLLPERPDVFILSFLNELDGEQAVALEALKKDTGIRVEVSPLPPGISQTLVDVLEEGGRTREHRLRMPGKALLVPREDITNQTVTGAIMEWRRRTGDTLARPYDMVVRAMGKIPIKGKGNMAVHRLELHSKSLPTIEQRSREY